MAHGLMELESQKPIAKNGLFWIAPMSKPVAGAAHAVEVEFERFLEAAAGLVFGFAHSRASGNVGATAEKPVRVCSMTTAYRIPPIITRTRRLDYLEAAARARTDRRA